MLDSCRACARGTPEPLYTAADLERAVDAERERIEAMACANSERADLDPLVRAVWATLAVELREDMRRARGKR
jgi:hypothetical protein